MAAVINVSFIALNTYSSLKLKKYASYPFLNASANIVIKGTTSIISKKATAIKINEYFTNLDSVCELCELLIVFILPPFLFFLNSIFVKY